MNIFFVTHTIIHKNESKILPKKGRDLQKGVEERKSQNQN